MKTIQLIMIFLGLLFSVKSHLSYFKHTHQTPVYNYFDNFNCNFPLYYSYSYSDYSNYCGSYGNLNNYGLNYNLGGNYNLIGTAA